MPVLKLNDAVDFKSSFMCYVLFKAPLWNPQQHLPENPPCFPILATFATSYSTQLPSSLSYSKSALLTLAWVDHASSSLCGWLLSLSTVPLRASQPCVKTLTVAEVLPVVVSISPCFYYVGSLSSFHWGSSRVVILICLIFIEGIVLIMERFWNRSRKKWSHSNITCRSVSLESFSPVCGVVWLWLCLYSLILPTLVEVVVVV